MPDRKRTRVPDHGQQQEGTNYKLEKFSCTSLRQHISLQNCRQLQLFITVWCCRRPIPAGFQQQTAVHLARKGEASLLSSAHPLCDYNYFVLFYQGLCNLRGNLLDDLLWKDERGPSSNRRTLEPFPRQRWGKVWETGWSTYGLFRAQRYHLELNWTVLY